ncbi:transcriptional regulatory moc3 [Fusarium tjaetaba]|uniref:Transcriptional regulatory moc3 n=1 Tax=Fusarium tjaetaba TaxID=1567544 RepID=A0A8H5VR79_9HYPO|nr:transcriptional regulatory moc3 [Fusarium tjaetaba]KAF5632656.1 transcriptional regulatory moc3 [Fusarium tjaetaba]
MGDYYHHFLSSMSGAGMNPATSPEEMLDPRMHGAPIPMVSAPLPGPYQQLGYFTGFPDPMMFNQNKSQKARRKSAAGTPAAVDHVKHRRTRSGCFMCRSRRVKCDETRPICERCKKGNRECVYPDPPSSKGSSASSGKSKDTATSAQQTSPTSSKSEDDEDTEQESKLEMIVDEDEDTEDQTKSSVPSRQSKSVSPSTATATPSSLAAVYSSSEFPIQTGEADWSHLPPEYQQGLSFFVENLNHFNYCIPLDSDGFFTNILPNMATRHEPLLNALVGFSAYHITLRNPQGKLQDFLQYYNKSVTQLLGLFKRREKPNVATLLTILQLATIEEYFGDWVNLMGHQKAAFEIITSIFTPQTVMQTPVGRMCLSWYARFDNFVALMGGFPTDLPREWFRAMLDFYQSGITSNPDELHWKIDAWSARLRLISYDMSILFARGSRGQISQEDFMKEHELLNQQLIEWKEKRDPALQDPKYLIKDFPSAETLDPDDFVNPYTVGILYDFPLFDVTVLCAEWNSIMIMHKCQSSGMRPDQLFADLNRHAYRTCQYFETLEFWPSTPRGVLVLIQACIAIAALFCPQDARHHMWFRRKFALLETMGYIHPLPLRTKMAELFREPDCVNWWLPNEEGFSPVLQEIRNFADERNAAAVTAQQESVREVRHIFAKMSLMDDANAPSSSSPDSASGPSVDSPSVKR